MDEVPEGAPGNSSLLSVSALRLSHLEFAGYSHNVLVATECFRVSCVCLMEFDSKALSLAAVLTMNLIAQLTTWPPQGC